LQLNALCVYVIILYCLIEDIAMKPNILKLLERCIEDGVQTGVHRSFKYTNEPTREQIVEEVLHNVMHELHEWFEFEPPEDTY